MSEVAALLARAREAPAGASPLDAVMGEDWAVLKGHRPGTARNIELAVGRQGTRRRYLGTMRKPQAMVKLVTRGGARKQAGVMAQMAYLSRDGAVPMYRSARYMDVEIDQEDQEALAHAWMRNTRDAAFDYTSHFVVSFPKGTDPDAAERAGRAWAEAAFESGRLGERWDYYTVHHRDTDTPHTHVVVARRGLEGGGWLVVSSFHDRATATHDELRALQVEVAEAEGIALDASSRLSRGIHERPIPDAEYRRAWEEKRAARAPAHTPMTAATAAASLVGFARQYEADAAAVETRDPTTAAALRRAAKALGDGIAIESLVDVEDDSSDRGMVYATRSAQRGDVASLQVHVSDDEADVVRASRSSLPRTVSSGEPTMSGDEAGSSAAHDHRAGRDGMSDTRERREDKAAAAAREIEEARREVAGIENPAQRAAFSRALDVESRALEELNARRRESEGREGGDRASRDAIGERGIETPSAGRDTNGREAPEKIVPQAGRETREQASADAEATPRPETRAGDRAPSREAEQREQVEDGQGGSTPAERARLDAQRQRFEMLRRDEAERDRTEERSRDRTGERSRSRSRDDDGYGL